MTRASRIEAAARAVVDAWDEDGRITIACEALRAALDSRDNEPRPGGGSRYTHSGPPAPEFPRAPVDDVEFEASRTSYREFCASISDDDYGCCTRSPHTTGDHVSATGWGILARWPQAAKVEEPQAEEPKPAKGPVIGWRIWLGDGYYEGSLGCQPVSRERAFLFCDGGSFVYDTDHGGGRAWVRAVAQFLREQYGATPRVRAVRRKVRP